MEVSKQEFSVQVVGGGIKPLTERVSDRFKSCKNFNAGGLNLGFTLAEMMVVMLILTIVLAAFAPLMTKRKTVDLSSPWRYASNNSDIYYGLGSNQSAMIGQNSKADNDLNSRLTINTSGDKQPHITFKKGNNHLANLIIKGTSFMFGGPYTSDTLKVTGANNTALGYQSLLNLEGGANNTAIGYQSLNNLTSGKHNTAVGYNSQRYATGEFNTSIGSNSLRGIEGAKNDSNQNANTGSQNTILGYEAGRRLTSGKDNVAVGYGTLGAGASTNVEQFTGSQNTAVGSASLIDLTTGKNNTALGYISLRKTTTGEANTAVGVNALEANTTGNSNTAVGYNALGNLTTGSENVAIGRGALTGIKTSSGNTAIGYNACKYLADDPANGIDASNKTCIGVDSGPSDNWRGYGSKGSSFAMQDNKVIYLGDKDTTVIIPGTLRVDNDVFLGYLPTVQNTAAGYIFSIYNAHTTGNTTADRLFDYVKTIVVNLPNRGSEFENSNTWNKKSAYVKAILYERDKGGLGNPEYGSNGDIGYYVIAKHKKDDNNPYSKVYTSLSGSNNNTMSHYYYLSDMLLKNIKGENKAGLEQIRQLKVFNYTFKKDKEKTPHVGVIAQDLEKVFPKAVKKGEDGYLLIRQEDMFYAVINAVKQLDKLVQGIINELKIIELKLNTLIKQETDKDMKIQALEKDNANLKKDNEYLKKEIADINKRLKAIE